MPLLQLKAPTAVQTPRGEATVEQTSGVEASRDEQQRDAHAAETYQQDRSKRVLYTDTGLHLAVSTSNQSNSLNLLCQLCSLDRGQTLGTADVHD